MQPMRIPELGGSFPASASGTGFGGATSLAGYSNNTSPLFTLSSSSSAMLGEQHRHMVRQRSHETMMVEVAARTCERT